ncbi:E4 protein [Human papillomavirus 178]|uniref:E4 protein n=1 Tax=Human papillomavirus 178 TaxID=1478160 RepID=X2G698_9PAPI|nr:E4 protein [Human papillomavirus 178]AHN16189.1 E4 protein [Human papillomavirus 178]
MACIMLKLVVTKYTLHYLMQMIKGLEAPEYGVCILKIKLFPPLAALQVPSPLTPGRTTPPFPVPPKTPYPNRKAQDDSKNRRSALVPVPGRKHLQFDDDEKENLPPKDNLPPQQREEEEELEEEEEEELNELSRLLTKWGRDIDRFQQRICQDLHDFRKKLGIPQS